MASSIKRVRMVVNVPVVSISLRSNSRWTSRKRNLETISAVSASNSVLSTTVAVLSSTSGAVDILTICSWNRVARNDPVLGWNAITGATIDAKAIATTPLSNFIFLVLSSCFKFSFNLFRDCDMSKEDTVVELRRHKNSLEFFNRNSFFDPVATFSGICVEDTDAAVSDMF